MYFRTVRGDTRRPSLSSSSLAMRSWPHVGLSWAIWRMSACNSAGIRGRPGRDFQRQNSRNPWRCQRINVAGCTMAKAWRQSNQRAEPDQGEAGRSGGTLGLDVAFLIQGQLFTQKEVFCRECRRERRQRRRNRMTSTSSASSVPVRYHTWWSRYVHRVMAKESLCSKVVLPDYYPCCEG